MAESWLNIKIAFYGIIAIKGDVNSRLLVLFINMEILSLSFAFFVFKLAICIVPIVLGTVETTVLLLAGKFLTAARPTGGRRCVATAVVGERCGCVPSQIVQPVRPKHVR